MSLKKTKSDFISEAIRIYQNKYDYTKVEYINNSTKVCIICPEHGEFFKSPKHHLQGQGCPLCSKQSASLKRSLTSESFIKKAREVHGDKYDYSKVEYVNNSTKVCIICLKHGEFWQTPKNHLKGQGCPKCSGRFHSDTEFFIERAREVHGDKYDYSKVEYVNSKTKVCIICPKHGEFWQSPQEHIQKKGCPRCGIDIVADNKRQTTAEFIRQSNIVHDFKYTYDKVNYKNINTEVTISCPIHGDFKQLPYVHLQGYGCSKCSGRYQYSTEEFIEKAREVHGDKYDYSNVKYVKSHDKIKIICPIHGVFEQRAYEHLQGRGCPKCSHTCSRSEQEIVKYIESFFGTVEVKNKRVLNGKELDIYIPEKKVAIEYNGLIWHSEKFGKDKNYHLNKTVECEKQGIQLIHIFEDEWLQHTNIVKSKLKHILGCDHDLPKVYARKCNVCEISGKKAKDFLEINHIQGYAKSTVYFGCFYDNNIVGVMSFKREKKNEDYWELTRFATDITKQCIGIGGKLFNHFVSLYKPKEVKSFADRRWSTMLNDNLYSKLGFRVDKILRPEYRYIVNDKRMHKFGFRKQRLLKKFGNYGINNDMSEYEMAKKLGFHRIYDCGLIKYKWQKV